jgi:hypothetical protein
MLTSFNLLERRRCRRVAGGTSKARRADGFVVVMSFVLVAGLRRRFLVGGPGMKWLGRFGRFWYDFVVGDDWTIAAAVVLVVGLDGSRTTDGTCGRCCWRAWLPLSERRCAEESASPPASRESGFALVYTE